MQPERRKVAVGLVRCSTDMQDHSIDDQEAEIRAWAKEADRDLLQIFRDEGVSGCELERPGIMAVMAFLQANPDKGTFVAWTRNRLARPVDPRDGLELERRIERLGWKIHYLRGSAPSGNVLIDSIMGLVEHDKNGQYLKDLSVDVLRSQHKRILAGDVPGGKVPYGYAKVVTDSAGAQRTVLRTTKHRKLKEERVQWVPGDETEVRVVRQIFDLYVTGHGGFAEIARKLNDDAIAAPAGGKWVSGTIREVLTNRVYTGDLVWNKETSSRFFRLKRGRIEAQDAPRATTRPSSRAMTTYKRNAVADLVVVEDHHEPLVERSTFHRAAELMATRGKGQGRRRGQRPVHPLSGLVFCGSCGEPMYARSTTAGDHRYRKYGCSKYERNRECAANSITADALEYAAIYVIKEACLPKGKPIDGLRDQFSEVIQRKLDEEPKPIDSDALKRERDQIEGSIRQACINMGKVQADAALRHIADQISSWNSRKAVIEAELLRDEGRKLERLHQAGKAYEIADQLIAVLHDLAKMTKGSTAAEKRALFERGVKRVEVDFKTVPAANGRKRQRHLVLGASVQTNDLLGVAQEVVLPESKLLG